jgi:hypothetical protein
LDPRYIQDATWKELKVGCLVFEGGVPQKQIISITDRSILDMLRLDFNIKQVAGSDWGVPDRNNRMEIHLVDGEIWTMCFLFTPNDKEGVALYKTPYSYRIGIEKTFHERLKAHLETVTGKRIELSLDDNEYNHLLGRQWKYFFRDIDFGKGDFCFLLSNMDCELNNAIPDGFFFEQASDKTYCKKVVSYLKLNDIDISKIIFIYSTDPTVSSLSNNIGIEMIHKSFRQTTFFKLVEFAIANKTKIVIKGKNDSIPFTKCTTENDLELAIRTQLRTKGDIAIIFTPPL